MSENQDLLSQLEEMLHWKRSKKFYADKLSVTEATISELLQKLRGQTYDDNISTYITDIQIDDLSINFAEDLTKGTGELTFDSKEEIKTLEELIIKCNIDVTKWDIIKYVQNYWGNASTPHWQVKAWLGKKSTEQVLQDAFVDFLSTYTPKSIDISAPLYELDKPFGCLLINKQDAHYNRQDGVGSDNDIDKRFKNIFDKTEVIIKQAKLSNNLEKILYILGSDAFNSEHTGLTTGGTPQENILKFHEAFEKICNHEVEVIQMMLTLGTNIEIVFMPGNHDEYVGWHMISWLKVYFRNEERLVFDISPEYRKYVSYGESAMMFNHGDKIKPERLAAMFPIEYREAWSFHKNFYIFTGDKHTEMSHDYNGIEFYRISAFSTVSSKWEDKNGFTGRKSGVTGFLIDKTYGITNIFKQYL